MEIYLDACIAIYLVEEHPAYAPLVAARLRGGVGRIAYSPLVEMECLVLPMRQQRIELVRRYRQNPTAITKKLEAESMGSDSI